MSLIRLKVAALLLVSVFFVGCATKPTTLYQWEGYQNNIDAHFRTNKLSPDAQTQLMEADLQKILASGKAVPPGYQAHLGLLYGQQGNLDKFALQMQAERKQFPESETFMDFLLRNFKKNEVKQ
jgi:hypothetical protein